MNSAPTRDRLVNRSARLWTVLALNVLLVAALIAVGVSAHSLGVFAEGADYLADAAAIAVSLLAIRLSTRPTTARHPQGYPKATTWAAAVNAGWLLLLNLLVIGGAIDRLTRGARVVHGLPVLVISGIAAAVMLAGALILHGDIDDDTDDSEGDLNMRAVLLDTAADAAAAAGVASAGALILIIGGWYWLDPTVALLIAVAVSYHAARLLRHITAALRR